MRKSSITPLHFTCVPCRGSLAFPVVGSAAPSPTTMLFDLVDVSALSYPYPFSLSPLGAIL